MAGESKGAKLVMFLIGRGGTAGRAGGGSCHRSDGEREGAGEKRQRLAESLTEGPRVPGVVGR